MITSVVFPVASLDYAYRRVAGPGPLPPHAYRQSHLYSCQERRKDVAALGPPR